jgi:negative regulator of sigma-B (phosphoserine phosphatase)
MSAPTRGVAAAGPRECVTWAVAEAPYPNEPESGDRYVVQPCSEGVLIAAVDGMGHGVEAAAAAKIAAATLAAHAGESPIALLLRCHDELKGTRGAVITTAFIHQRDETLTWLGVGNVEARLFHAGDRAISKPERALLRNGILGYRMPPMRAEILALKPRDTLVIVTDGITPDFEDGLAINDDLQAVADSILSRHRTGADDALVVVARYLGGKSEPPTA